MRRKNQTNTATPDPPKSPPSASAVISWFYDKPGSGLSHLRKDFHALSKDARRAVIEDIQNGFDPAATIELYKDETQ